MKEPLGLIYIIVNKINGKVYIGQTRKTLSERIRHHFSKWETCSKLRKAIEEYGQENFEYNVLQQVPFSELNKAETYYIKQYNSVENGYNIKEGNKNFRGRSVHSLKDIEEDVIKDYKNSISIEELSSKYKIAITSVYNILERNDIHRMYNKGGFHPNHAKIDYDKMIKLLKLGWNYSKIAKFFGVNRSNVRRMYERHKNIIHPRVSNISAS